MTRMIELVFERVEIMFREGENVCFHKVFGIFQLQGHFKSFPDILTLPNNKILDWYKFKAFADDKIIQPQ